MQLLNNMIEKNQSRRTAVLECLCKTTFASDYLSEHISCIYNLFTDFALDGGLSNAITYVNRGTTLFLQGLNRVVSPEPSHHLTKNHPIQYFLPHFLKQEFDLDLLSFTRNYKFKS